MVFLPPCTGPEESKHSLNGSHTAACCLTIDYLLPKAKLWLCEKYDCYLALQKAYSYSLATSAVYGCLGLA